MVELPERGILEELALANRILFNQGVLDAFGHVSARHPTDPDHFLLSRNMAPAQVTADDVLLFDASSEPCEPKGRRVYLERFIHGEIYRARPDVSAVVHSHSKAMIPFGVTEVPLRAVCHMAGFLASGAARFEIRCCAGESSNLLITDRQLGAELARSLGDYPVVLMRGHGSTTVGTSLRQAVFRAVYAEVNADLQLDAHRLGPVTYLTDGEGAAAATANDGQVNRAWDLWCRQAKHSLN